MFFFPSFFFVVEVYLILMRKGKVTRLFVLNKKSCSLINILMNYIIKQKEKKDFVDIFYLFLNVPKIEQT